MNTYNKLRKLNNNTLTGIIETSKQKLKIENNTMIKNSYNLKIRTAENILNNRIKSTDEGK